MFSKKKLTKADLLNDLELNVKLSMEILRYLKNKYGSWELALGAYNTGKPIINQYAQQIVQFKCNNKFKNPS
jgi:soluble lytic murein transglycosylase-like protein